MRDSQTTKEKIDLLIETTSQIRTSHAVLESRTAEIARRLCDMQSNMVTREVCDARHKPLNGFFSNLAADRRAKWSLYLMGSGIVVSIILSAANLLLM